MATLAAARLHCLEEKSCRRVLSSGDCYRWKERGKNVSETITNGVQIIFVTLLLWEFGKSGV
jgi:hypothetical protein